MENPDKNLTIKRFAEIWEQGTDQERCIWLYTHRNSLRFPKYKINVDNDSVFISFDEHEAYGGDEDNPTILEFDEFGYHLIPHLFGAMGIEAEMV